MTDTEDLPTQHTAALADFRDALKRGDHAAMEAASDRELAIRTAMVRRLVAARAAIAKAKGEPSSPHPPADEIDDLLAAKALETQP